MTKGPGHLLRTSAYTVVALVAAILIGPAWGTIHLAVIGVWEDKVLATLAAAGIVGSGLITAAIKVGPALRRLAPAFVDIRKAIGEITEALRATNARVDENTGRADAAQAVADEAKARADRLEDEVERLKMEEARAKAAREHERDAHQANTASLELQIRELRDGSRGAATLADKAVQGVNQTSDGLVGLGDKLGVEVSSSPRIEPDLAEAAAVVAARKPIQVNPGLPRLLLIEDDHASRTAVAKLLRWDGWDVTEASDGIDGSRHLHSMARPFDAACVDLKMPGKQGPEVIRIIRAQRMTSPRTRKPTRVVAYTGCDHGDRPDVGDPLIKASIEAGADAIKFKPCEIADLVAVLLGEGTGDLTFEPRSQPEPPKVIP